MAENPLNQLLRQIMQRNQKIEAAILVSRDGSPVTSILGNNVSATTLAATLTSIHNYCERIFAEWRRGELDECIIQGKTSKIVIMGAGRDYIVAFAIRGNLHSEMQNVSQQIADLMK